MPPILLLIIGLVVLVVGAEALVRGASRLALAAGLSRLVVGLVVVSLGTSAPEIAISVGASLQGNGDLAIGNVVGSNTFNVLFILGLTALVTPLAVQRRLVRIDIPIMALVSLLLVALAANGHLGLVEGIVLLVLAAGYLIMNVILGRTEGDQPEFADPARPASAGAPRGLRPLAVAALLAVVGVIALVVGARVAVGAATDLARALGASDLVIGLTIVAAGTSLPEVATSLLAAIRGERDIAVGNIVGSNILNIALILGLSSVVAPEGLVVPLGAITFDLPVMTLVAIALLPVAFTRHAIARWEGAIFLGYYVFYVVHLILTASAHPRQDELAFAVGWFVVPLTLILIAAAVSREIGRRRARARHQG